MTIYSHPLINHDHVKLIHILKEKQTYSKKKIIKVTKMSLDSVLTLCNQLNKLGANIETGSNIVCKTNWLDIRLLKEAMREPGALPDCHLLTTVDSTNNYLLTLAKTGGMIPAICLAEHQSHGRGQQQNHWCSPLACNLYVSVAIPLPDDPQLSITVADITTQAIKAYGIQADLTVKPPNDILYNGKKIAGILIDTIQRKNNPVAIIGIGVNLNMTLSNVTPHIGQPWTDLAHIHGRPIDRNQFAANLIEAILSTLLN